ncbi:NUDIX domain-containing protein [Streptomyces cinerochromogenes]|uniref:NUDIX domain-containing protein n=1 Tax=Streptomyces cinerochromogenes TaxID=66422 RepID=UPI00369FADA8
MNLTASAAALFCNEDSEVLIVNPTYKDYWNLPGGGVDIDRGETPYDAVVREVREELGITPPIGRLLAHAWITGAGKEAKVLYIFDGGILSREDQEAITLQTSELSEYRFCHPEEEPGLIPPHLTDVWMESVFALNKKHINYVSVKL